MDTIIAFIFFLLIFVAAYSIISFILKLFSGSDSSGGSLFGALLSIIFLGFLFSSGDDDCDI